VPNREATEQIQRLMPLCATMNVDVERFTSEEVALAMEWAVELCTSNGLLHGGAIMALADSAGAACASLNLPEGSTGTSTIESKTNFLGAVREGRLTAVARPLHVGTTTIVVETEVRSSTGRLVAKTTQTQAVLRPRP
jgi:1,4-dihydroxy-2-naphthoyl-CoA hydrolase